MKKWGTSLAGEMDRVIDAVGTTMRDVDNIVRTGQRRAALKAGTDRPAAGMTLGQLSDDPSSVANSLEGVAQSTWFNGVANQQRAWSNEGAVQFADDLATQLKGVSTEEVGKNLTWAVENNFTRLYSDAADSAYDGLRAATQGTRPIIAVSELRSLRDPNDALGKSVVAHLRKIRGVNQDPEKISEIDGLIKLIRVTESQAKKGALTRTLPNLSLEQALRLKNTLTTIADGVNVNTASNTDKAMKATAETLSNTLDDNIRAGLKKSSDPALGQDLLREYDSAKADYAKGIDTFKNELVTKVVNGLLDKPGALESTLLKPEQREVITAVKNAVGPVWESHFAPKLRSIMLMYAKEGDTYSGSKLMQSIIDLIGPNPAEPFP